MAAPDLLIATPLNSPVPSDEKEPPGSYDPPASWAGAAYLRVVAGAAVAFAVAGAAVLNRAVIDSGGDSLAGGNREWLGLALALMTAVWVAGTAAQLGAVPIRPPVRQLFAVQVAASVANQVVPGGVGGMAVNVRYLQRSGMTRSAAVAAVGMNSVATLFTHLALIVALWSLGPHVLPSGALSVLLRPAAVGLGRTANFLLPGSSLLVACALATAAGIAVAARVAGATRLRRLGRRLRTASTRGAAHLRCELRDAGHVLLQPGRAALLWAGSAASPVLHALILVAVCNSLSAGISGLAVALVYLVASSLAALVPSPGGFGALDVTLVAGLVAVGAPTTTAVAAVLGYRLITVWVPLVPGALVLASLLRRRVL